LLYFIVIRLLDCERFLCVFTKLFQNLEKKLKSYFNKTARIVLQVVDRGIDGTEHSPSSGADGLYLDFVSIFLWLRKWESFT
jgi:hypothetical protein